MVSDLLINQSDAKPDEFDENPAGGVREACPAWLADLRRSSHRKGFYRSLGDHALFFADRGSDRLLVCFDNLASVRDDTVHRDPWGYRFVAKQGWSQLAVMAFRPDWFRDPELFEAMRDLAAQGFFRRFRNVTLTGTSMGGYAACAFASLIPGCKVIAYSPQSTLAKALVPWEKRFSSGRKADWSGPFADATIQIADAAEVWLIFDPLLEDDRRHAERFSGANVHHLRMRNGGHKTAFVLRRAGLLSQVTCDVVENRMTEARFYAAYRTIHRQPWFLYATAQRAISGNRPQLVARMVRYLHANGQAFAAHNLRKQYLIGTEHDPLHT